MRETIGRMLGTLPPQYFQVTVSTQSSEDLAQLFYSVMMTGYLFRNAQYRLELRRKMDYQLPAGADHAADNLWTELHYIVKSFMEISAFTVTIWMLALFRKLPLIMVSDWQRLLRTLLQSLNVLQSVAMKMLVLSL